MKRALMTGIGAVVLGAAASVSADPSNAPSRDAEPPGLTLRLDAMSNTPRSPQLRTTLAGLQRHIADCVVPELADGQTYVAAIDVAVASTGRVSVAERSPDDDLGNLMVASVYRCVAERLAARVRLGPGVASTETLTMRWVTPSPPPDPVGSRNDLNEGHHGDAYGFGGPVLRDGVRGGGLGLGTLGTIGRGSGAGTGPSIGSGTGFGLGRAPRGALPRLTPLPRDSRNVTTSIQRVLRRVHNQLVYCYEQGLLRQPDLAGTVAIRFVISPSGAVTESAIARSDLAGDAPACMARATRRWSFPDQRAATTVVYAFRVEPRGGN